MEELLQHLDNGKTLVYVSLAAMIITFITHLIFKKYRFVKYLPGFIFMGIGLYSFYQVMNDLTANESISNILLFLMGFIGGTIGLFTGLIIGIYNKPKRIRKTHNKEIEDKED